MIGMVNESTRLYTSGSASGSLWRLRDASTACGQFIQSVQAWCEGHETDACEGAGEWFIQTSSFIFNLNGINLVSDGDGTLVTV